MRVFRPLEPAMRAIAILLVATAVAQAQGIQLTPAQQQMLNSLPPAQRQQALSALQQVQSQQSQPAQTSIRESDIDSRLAQDLSPVNTDDDAEEILRADAGSRLVIIFSPKETLPRTELAKLGKDPVLRQLMGSHNYILDDAGVLSLQGLQVIPLLGLSEPDIERRLGAENFLAMFDISASILETRLTGKEALRPFGYKLFEPKQGSFDPPMSGPVPPDYVLGPGDVVRVQLFGNLNGIYEYEVSRDGILNLPEIGPVTVAGIPFSEFRVDLNNRVREMLIGTQVSVTMGPLRTIRVFVLGDVNNPGSYVVSGLATISSALYRSGGISDIGSLRNIELKRAGRRVSRLDLYDLLLHGDTSGDARLQPGDVIFVPPIGKTIGVGGAVKRPAFYEMKSGSTIGDAVSLAGGFAADAYAHRARLERIDANRERRVVSVDLTDAEQNLIRTQAGDILMIPKVLPELEDTVMLAGHVQRPGPYEWFPGMRLTDVVTSPTELKSGVDDQYVLIRREKVRGQPIEVFSADLGAALRDPEGTENIALESRDTVHVFSLAFGRQRVIAPLMDELQLQSSFMKPFQKTEISGNVRAAGIYPLEPGMRVSDLIRAGGSLTEQAYTQKAELSRYTVAEGEVRQTDVTVIDLQAILRGDDSADVELSPHDHLSITRIPKWESAWSVELDGEVKFPGTYRIRRGESLFSVLQRAGGLTTEAFPEGAVFLRESLRVREQEQVELLARRLEADLAALSLQSIDSPGSEALSTGQALLDQLHQTEAVGRLVIDVDRLKSDSEGPVSSLIELRDGDTLLVPQKSQVVTVIGETQQNTSHFYYPGLSRDDYVDLSGGTTRRADKKRIYIVRANGSVVTGKSTRWLGRNNRVDVQPGDTIVVPMDTDKIRPLTFWTNVTQILYQGAIAVAAIKTFGN